MADVLFAAVRLDIGNSPAGHRRWVTGRDYLRSALEYGGPLIRDNVTLITPPKASAALPAQPTGSNWRANRRRIC